MHTAEIYTDGSCHTQQCIGAWAAILFINEEKIILSGKETATTHNRMELMAVIKAIEFIKDKYSAVTDFKIISDSQYVVGLKVRKEKLLAQNFLTKKRNEIRNADLVEELVKQTANLNIQFVKIKAHQKKTTITNYNIEADKLCRKIVREACAE